MLSVPRCICCKERLNINDTVYCSSCLDTFNKSLDRQCSFCFNKLSECSCVPEYLKTHFVKNLYKVFRYTGKDDNKAASSLIYSLKEHTRRDEVKFAAQLLYSSLKNADLPKDTIVTNVPRRAAAILNYGYDHSRKIAECLAKMLGFEYKLLLKSKAKSEQKHLTREERLKNSRMVLKKDIDLTGRCVLIVDDIVTSGASVSAAACLIRGLGCKNICAASLGIAYRDKM